MTIHILIADDHPVVRDGLVAVLNTQSDLEVVGEASNGQEVIEQTATLQPDILLLDLEMPELDGVTALQQLKQQGSLVRTIVFTAFDTDERILKAVQAGAQGYLLKGTPREELFQAIRIVQAGGSLLQPIVASKLLRQVSQPTVAQVESLTPREMDVLQLLGEGRLNKEIAAELKITQRTVKFHVSSILSKLGASNRTEAVTMAVHQGLITL